MSDYGKKILIALLAVVLVFTVLIAGIGMRNRTGKEESSDETSNAIVTDIIIVPSEMPSHITFEIPPGFTETTSQYYDKYYIRNDASIIVTGETLTIGGMRLDEYTNEVKKQYESTADAYTLLGDDQITLNGELPCRVLQFSYAIIGENVRQDMQCITAVLLKDDFAYIITCKSKRETAGVYHSAFLRTIESIRIEDSSTPATSTAAKQESSAAAET